MDKINIEINSKKRFRWKISNFTVRIPKNLRTFFVKCKWFLMLYSWLNCIDGFNNEFQTVIKIFKKIWKKYEIVDTYIYELNDGNPNVNEEKSNLDGLLIIKF